MIAGVPLSRSVEFHIPGHAGHETKDGAHIMQNGVPELCGSSDGQDQGADRVVIHERRLSSFSSWPPVQPE